MNRLVETVHNDFAPHGSPVQTGEESYGFTGEWWESDVELLHLRARWYLPESGTFLSRDTWEGDMMTPQTMNQHNYVGGNPVNRTDPTGHCWWLEGQDYNHCMLFVHDNAPQPARDFAYDVVSGFRDQFPLYDFYYTAASSHLNQETDGFVIGITGDFGFWQLGGGRDFNAPADAFVFEMHRCQFSRTGHGIGIEVVFDYKHQETGLFWYASDMLHIDQFAGVNLGTYIGETRGFANNSYADGVNAYVGQSAMFSFGIERPGIDIGVSRIEAIPLDPFTLSIDPSGVYVTYYNLGTGISASFPFVASVSQAQVRDLWRKCYVPGECSDDHPEKKDLQTRAAIAMIMANDMERIAKFLSYTINPTLETHVKRTEIPRLWEYVDRP